jgi:hypothetical protein
VEVGAVGVAALDGVASDRMPSRVATATKAKIAVKGYRRPWALLGPTMFRE